MVEVLAAAAMTYFFGGVISGCYMGFLVSRRHRNPVPSTAQILADAAKILAGSVVPEGFPDWWEVMFVVVLGFLCWPGMFLVMIVAA